MTERLTVYAYNVLFGDALLVEVPDGNQRRFILIDVGNKVGRGGSDRPMLDAMDDVIARTGGHIDLYIMTHEHIDHVQGLLYASARGRNLTVDSVWMTASAAPNYYENHPDAHRKKNLLEAALQGFDAARGKSYLPQELADVLELNAHSTGEYVDHIRQLHPEPHYVHRESDLDGCHPFTEARLRILAPEDDTSDYYGFTAGPRVAAPGSRTGGVAARPTPPRGVDAGAFYELIDRMDLGLGEAALMIDQAQNYTSLVVEVTWRHRRLLFTGDAELKSWHKMKQNNANPNLQGAELYPVDLLKVGHHGSENGTPSADILDLVLPRKRRRRAVAIVSACSGAYHGVPDESTLSAIGQRTRRIYNTASVEEGIPVIIRFASGR
jgi:beta-lactamase superfamily II metal-dependent hydrolase